MCYKTCSPNIILLPVHMYVCWALRNPSNLLFPNDQLFARPEPSQALFLLDLHDGPASACDGQPAPALHSLQAVNSPYPLTKFLALNTPQGNLVLTVQDEPWRRPAFEKMGLMGAGDPWEGLVGTAAGAANQQPLPHLWGCKMLFFKGICSFQLRMRVQEAQL